MMWRPHGSDVAEMAWTSMVEISGLQCVVVGPTCDMDATTEEVDSSIE
jgi:hypothetical protein